MKFRLILSALLTVLSSHAWSADGLIALRSPYQVSETVDRLETIVTEKGMTVFARIDHAAGAAKVGKHLRPTQLLIFGNPKGGTLLMQCAQTSAIDLPLKMLAWEDENGAAWLAYNDPDFLAKRHAIAQCPVVAKMREALGRFAALAVAP